MTGKTITTEELSAAVAAYCKATGKQSSTDEAGKIRLFAGSPDPATDRVLWLEDGNLRGDDLDFTLSFAEDYLKPSVSLVNGRSQADKAIVPTAGRKCQGEALVRPREINSLSRDEVRKFTKCFDANDDEVDYFVEVCWRRGLNIFAGDAFLVKYGGKNPAASIIVSKEAFMKKAERNPQFDGMESGIILQVGDEVKEIDGTFYVGEKKNILGAWARVYRKDRSHPSVAKVAISEFRGDNHFWNGKPAVMINKVAEMTALRKAFPNDLGALYGAEECGVDLGIDPENEVQVEAAA